MKRKVSVVEEKEKIKIGFGSTPLLIAGLIIAFAITFLSSCSEGASRSTYKKNAEVIPNITAYSNLENGEFFYIVDENTNVVYLCCDGVNQFGMTVMLKADGTPMLAQDLGLR